MPYISSSDGVKIIYEVLGESDIARIADNNLNIIDRMDLSQEEKDSILGENIKKASASRT